MVISDVGDEDIMMMGYMFSAQDVTGTTQTGGRQIRTLLTSLRLGI
jgi:hypothetical protein